ncbi:g2103 [Coccomyxa elongata]
MNFDLSSLDKLSQTQTTAKTSKFAPTARARPKRAAKSTPTDPQVTATRGTDAHEPAASGPGGPVPAVVESGAIADPTTSKGPRSAAASKASQAKVPPASSELPPASPRRHPIGYDIPSPSSGAAPSVTPASPGTSPQRRFLPRTSARKSKHPAESTEQGAGASITGHEMPGSSAGGPAGRAQLDLAVVPSQEPQVDNGTAVAPPQQGRKVRAKKRKEQEPLVLDVSTLNLRSIIKVAYAKERARLEEEKRKKEEEEAALQAAGGSAPVALAPAAAPAPAAPSAASLAPRVEVVDGQMRIVEQSLSIQAQPEAGARLITVEDNPKLNNMTYAKRMNNDRWSAEETELFYKALRLFGSDFTLLERMFPGRERKALKHKLRREYKADHARLDAALRGGGAASLDSYKEVVALLKQHTEDHENTGGMEGATEEQKPDLAAALLGSSGDPETTESDDNEENLLALSASGPQDGKQKGKPARTKASQRRSRLQPTGNAPAEGATVNNGAPAHVTDLSPPAMPLAVPEVLADGVLTSGKMPSGPTRGRVRPHIPPGRRKRTAPPAEGAQDGQEGEAAVGDAASPRSRGTKRRVLAAA